MVKDLPEIPFGHTPQVLLLGNGINRAFNFGSWDDLIQDIQTVPLDEAGKKELQKVPYPLQPVILTGDHVGSGMKKIAASLSELEPCEEEKEVLRTAAALPMDAILTANYTYELEKAVSKDFRCLPSRRCARRQKAHDSGKPSQNEALHTYMDVLPGKSIWHIHGEAAKPDTMILGHYYYGKLLSRVQQYIPILIRRNAEHRKKQEGMVYRSWVEYFMLGDVHIVGLGLDLSEMDLWWLINCKKRHFPDTKVYFYCPDLTPQKQMLAKAYHVNVNSDGLVDKDYRTYYKNVLDALKEKEKELWDFRL